MHKAWVANYKAWLEACLITCDSLVGIAFGVLNQKVAGPNPALSWLFYYHKKEL